MTTDTTEQTDPGGPTLTIDELAARAGVTVRTVRFYGTKGLLPPPALGPRRVGHYGPEHLARLALIDELQRQGMTLSAIERHLRRLPPDLSAQDLAIHRAVVASWAPDTVEAVTREELRRLAGRELSDTDVARLAALDVVACEDGGYRVDAGLLRLGVELLDVPLSQEVVLAAREVLLEHSRAAAQELSRLLRAAVSELAAEDVKSLTAHMHPLVVQALLTTFQRSLRQELRGWLSDPREPAGGEADEAAGGESSRGGLDG
ncbi:MerR family transcriptional regulator [Streptomyces dangxiongensis]|uniref:MerR family transcriptional regulator n=1 Tax=Streptomyces dangxiongensis TaxID=1442032 RepID=A0A3G2JCH2_9ACTN|nr:MerR family transcriptional regulator [Streptomyces dangxiongensis]AYN38429.1 MerR family transcriptional regulator [Streptomyces dangxiongensis]